MDKLGRGRGRLAASAPDMLIEPGFLFYDSRSKSQVTIKSKAAGIASVFPL